MLLLATNPTYRNVWTVIPSPHSRQAEWDKQEKTRAVWRQREFLTSREKLEDKGGPLIYSDNPPPPCFFSKKCQAGT